MRKALTARIDRVADYPRPFGDSCLVVDAGAPCSEPRDSFSFSSPARGLTLKPMDPLIESNREQLLLLARRRGVTSVRLFGSLARGEGRENSDVDLLVTLAPGISALALGGLLLDAQELLGRRVDVVTEASLHPALREQVLSSAILL